VEPVMKNKKELRQLQQIPSDFDDVSNLWWDERIKVAQMSDKHLDNAIQKLERCEYEYDSETLRLRWIALLKIEYFKREHERLATFNQNNDKMKAVDKDYANYVNNFPLHDPRD
jgi:hypothetical protein